MKKTVIVILALLLALTFLLSSCSAHGVTLMTAGSNEISVNVYQLYLSRMKWSLYAAGENVNSESYWGQYISLSGKTYKDHYTSQVLEGLKQIAAAMYLYDELGLKLSNEDEKMIDELIDTFVEEVGEGSEAKLNSVLAPYGANTTVLRDAYIIEAKLEQLKTHLYGQNGSKLTSVVLEEFYKQSYYRGYQLSVANYYYEHEKDKDGNAVYYQTKTAADGTVTLTDKIAYDTTRGVATAELDKNGDVVYRLQNEDESFGNIAYDKRNGAVNYSYDAQGNLIEKFYTTEEMNVRYENLKKIAEDCKNNEALFLEYAEFSDSSAFNDTYAPNGMYFSVNGYMGDELFKIFSAELAKLKEGELAIVEYTSSGKTHYYLLMRASLNVGAWNAEENSRWFQTMTSDAVEYMLQEKCKDYLQYVSMNDAALAGVDITAVSANKYY